uniref:hypothetical protein n=1 Tax=Brucella canis TaxID=36855 RepID=UPI003CF2787B
FLHGAYVVFLPKHLRPPLPINENTCQPLYGTLFFGEQARITLPVRILLPTTRAKLINSTITL